MSFIYTSQQVAHVAAVDLIAKNDATQMEQHNKSSGYFFTNKLLRNDYQEMINSMYNSYQHNNYDYSMSSSSVSSLDSSYSSSRSSQLTNTTFNNNNAPLITASSSQSTCSSPSASLEEQATCCLSDSSTSSLSSVHSSSADLALAHHNRSFQHRLQNQPNWSSVIYTPHLYPMLYEPCDYYYSPPGFQHHSYHNQLNQAEFEELDQNVNDLINNNSHNDEHKLLNKKLKDITNSESDSVFVKYGVKKWSQSQNTNNKCYFKKTADMENRMNKRYVNNNNNNQGKSTLAYSAVVIRNPSSGFGGNNNQGVEASKSYYGKKPTASFNAAKQQHVGVRGYGGVNKGYQYHYTSVNNGFNNNVINTTQQQQQQQSSNRYRSSGHILLKTRS